MKISALTIIILGIAIGFVILSYGYFHKYAPNMESARNAKTTYEAFAKVVNQSQAALARFDDAVEIRSQKGAEWQRYVVTNTPGRTLSKGGIDLSVNPWQLAMDAREFRNSAQLALNKQLKSGGVVVVNGPEIPFPEESSTSLLANYFNFPPYDYPIVIWELGTVTVKGTYKQITNNVRAWSNFKGYLAVVDGLTLTGTSPNLTGTYNLVIVGFLPGNDFYGSVNDGSSLAAAAAGSGPAAGGAPAAPGGAPKSSGPPGAAMKGVNAGGGQVAAPK